MERREEFNDFDANRSQAENCIGDDTLMFNRHKGFDGSAAERSMSANNSDAENILGLPDQEEQSQNSMSAVNLTEQSPPFSGT